MNNPDPDTTAPHGFYERYLAFSDSQIKEILKNHKNYQEAAVNAAVKIAIERQLIHSEQDLLAPEYQYQPSFNRTIFPVITDEYQHKKIVASIFRILFFLAIVPIVFGALKYSEGQLDMTYIGVASGFLWAFLTYLLQRTGKSAVLVLMITIVIFVFFGFGYRLLLQETFRAFDALILIVGTLLPLYFLFYLKKLNQTKP